MATRTPIYQRVKDRLREQIDTGSLVAGQRISSEKDLAGEYGCSRLTVHRALRELADEGLLVRNRRAGTLVAERDSSVVLVGVPRVQEEVARLGTDYRYELLSTRHAAPPDAVAGLLRVSPGAGMLQVVARHWAGDRVFQHEDRWINCEIAPEALEVDFSALGPHDWLRENVPHSCVDHDIRAVAADPDLAGAMQLVPGAVLLRVRRLAHLTVQRVTFAALHYPGDLGVLRSETQGYSLNAP